jgi:hypothetical protein
MQWHARCNELRAVNLVRGSEKRHLLGQLRGLRIALSCELSDEGVEVVEVSRPQDALIV